MLRLQSKSSSLKATVEHLNISFLYAYSALTRCCGCIKLCVILNCLNGVVEDITASKGPCYHSALPVSYRNAFLQSH